MDPFNKFFEKVGAYIVRNLHNDPQILLYSARYSPDAPLQVPGGGIHDDETPEIALEREVEEETGYENVPVIRKLGVSESPWLFRTMNRHVFLLDGSGMPESWSHTVTGDGADQGQRLHFSWYRIALQPHLGGDLGTFLNPESAPELYPAELRRG